MLGSAFAAANEAKQKLERERHQKRMKNIRKPRKQGWFKQPSGSGSHGSSSNATGSIHSRKKEKDNSMRSFPLSPQGLDESSGHVSYSTGVHTAPVAHSRSYSRNMVMESPHSRSSARTSNSYQRRRIPKLTSMGSDEFSPYDQSTTSLTSSSRRMDRRENNPSDLSNPNNNSNRGLIKSQNTRGQGMQRTASIRMMELQENSYSHHSGHMLGNHSSSRGRLEPHAEGLVNGHNNSFGAGMHLRGHVSFNEETISEISNRSTKNAVADALLDQADNEKMTDITLLGRGNTKVRAIKYVLACRSAKLQEVLFADPTSTEVYFGDYGEHSIQALKEYCQKGDVNASVLVNKKNAESIRGLMELARMAKDYGFDELYNATDSIVCTVLDASPWFATAAYDATAGSDATRDLEEYLIHFICGRCPDLLLDTNCLKHLSGPRFEVMLERIDSENVENFQFIQRWRELKEPLPENNDFARAMAYRMIDLGSLVAKPSMLDSIRSSGLFSIDEVETAMVLNQHNNSRSLSYKEDVHEEVYTVDIYGGKTPNNDLDGEETFTLDIYGGEKPTVLDGEETVDVYSLGACAGSKDDPESVASDADGEETIAIDIYADGGGNNAVLQSPPPPTSAMTPPPLHPRALPPQEAPPPPTTARPELSKVWSKSARTPSRSPGVFEDSNHSSDNSPGTLTSRYVPQPGLLTVSPPGVAVPTVATDKGLPPLPSRRPGMADEGLPAPPPKEKKEKKKKKKSKKSSSRDVKQLDGTCYQLSPGGDVLVCAVQDNVAADMGNTINTKADNGGN